VFTPAVSSLLFGFVATSGSVCPASSVVLEISSEVWRRFTYITSAQWGAGANTLYAFISNGPSNGQSAIARFGCPSDAATGAVISISQITGMSRTGLSAIRQFAVSQNNAASTVPLCTWGVSSLTANAVLAAVGANSSAGVTPMTNWTERLDVGYTTPLTGLEYFSRDSGNVSTTVSTGAAVSSLNAMIAIELNTSTIDRPMGDNLQCIYIR